MFVWLILELFFYYYLCPKNTSASTDSHILLDELIVLTGKYYFNTYIYIYYYASVLIYILYNCISNE